MPGIQILAIKTTRNKARAVDWDNQIRVLRSRNSGQDRLPLRKALVWDDKLNRFLSVASLGNIAVEQVRQHRRSSSSPIPVTTMLLVASATAMFVAPCGVLTRKVSLSPLRVVRRCNVGLLWTSSLAHLSSSHLCNNLCGIIPDLVAMEEQRGSARVGLDVVIMVGITSALYVGAACLQKTFTKTPSLYYGNLSGMSGLVYAVKVMTGLATPSGTYVPGFGPWRVSARWEWLFDLASNHMSVPKLATLTGHTCGVLAGYIQSLVISPALGSFLCKKPKIEVSTEAEEKADEETCSKPPPVEHKLLRKLLSVAVIVMAVVQQYKQAEAIAKKVAA